MRSVAQKRKSVKKPLKGKALLRATWNWIVKNPQKYDQGVVGECGGKFCFGGAAAKLAGLSSFREFSNNLFGFTENSIYVYENLYSIGTSMARIRKFIVNHLGTDRGLLQLPKQSKAVE